MFKIDLSSIELGRIKKDYLVVGFVALIIIIIFFAYKNIFSPTLSRIKKISAQIGKKKTNIERAKVGPLTLVELEQEIEALNKRMNYCQENLRSLADVPQILKELNRMAEQLNIRFSSVNPLEKEARLLPGGEEFIVQIPIKIQLQCGYHQFGTFINQIENSPRIMKIIELKINADPNNVWAHQTELTVSSYNLVSKKKLQIEDY